MAETLRQLGLDRTRARKGAVRPELTPSQIRGLLADVATGGGVPFIDAVSQAAQGNYGQAAISGLLDVPPVKMAGMALAPLIGMVRKSAPMDEALRIAQKNAAKPVSEGGLGLPPDNTPMDRAKALGYTTEAYKGMYPYDTRSGEIYGFKNGKWQPVENIGAKQDLITSMSQERTMPLEMGGKHAGFFGGKEIAEKFARQTTSSGATFPVLINMGDKAVLIDGKGRYAGSFQFEQQAIATAKQNPKDTKKIVENYNNFQDAFLQGNPATGVIAKNTIDEGTIFIPKEGKQVRSRFAAFDPARINENNLLASLAALGISVPVMRGLLQEEEMQ